MKCPHCGREISFWRYVFGECDCGYNPLDFLMTKTLGQGGRAIQIVGLLMLIGACFLCAIMLLR
jgi:hypothetical protein